MAVPKNTVFTDTMGTTATVEQFSRRLPASAWQRRSCGIGAKGLRVYEWALLDSDVPAHQYMIRRSIDDGELAFCRCHNPRRAGFGQLVNVAGARPTEHTSGQSADTDTAQPIHRRLISLTIAEIRRLLHAVSREQRRADPVEHALHWSTWRRAPQAEARRAHFRRRLHLQALMI